MDSNLVLCNKRNMEFFSLLLESHTLARVVRDLRDTISVMGTQQIVTLLIAERDRLNAAIEVLQGPPTKRRGRPPGAKNGVSATVTAPAPKKQGRRTFTPAQRKAQAVRMRRYWAEKKKHSK